jgi:hypothetical protein
MYKSKEHAKPEQTLNEPDRAAIVDFDRLKMGQPGGGIVVRN